MESFLEILKYIIPALIVLACSSFLLKRMLDSQYQLKALDLKSRYSKDAIALKLQAYERLLLFLDRIQVPNLIARLRTSAMRNDELKNVMMISVQKEYEHNIAQQLYTSPKLWEIIQLAKNDMIAFIELQADSLNPAGNSQELANQILGEYSQLKTKPIQLAIQAVKEEAKIILNV